MRRGLILNILATVILGMTSAIAQDNGTGFVGNGYYRIRNYVTERYIYFTDNRDYYDPTHDSEDYQAIQLWIGAEKAAASPASVVYINNVSGNNYDLTAQGTGIYALTGRYVNVKKYNDGTYEVSASASGVTKYLSDDEQNPDEQGMMGTKGSGFYRRWVVDKIETNHPTNYVGINPTMQVDGKYYQPYYAAYPFKAANSDMHIYYASKVVGSEVILKEIEGEIPAHFPVLIECTSPNASDNRIELLTATAANAPENKLDGTYFCNGSRPRESVDAYILFDAATMRVFTVSDGKLIATNDAQDRLKRTRVFNPENPGSLTKVWGYCIPENTSYLVADANTPAVLSVRFDTGKIEAIGDNNIFYEINKEKNIAEITYSPYGDKYEGNLVIPSSITYSGKSYRVTSIGKSAFSECVSLNSVTIPNSVTSIGNYAFSGCSSLSDIYCYAENVPTTDTNAFNDSPISSATLHVPEGSVESYKNTEPWSGFGTIVGMSSSNNIIDFVDAAVKALCIANWDTNCDGELDEAEAVVVTDLSTVFKGNRTITSFNELQYFTGLTSIGGSAFENCSSLTSITIPEGVTSIGDYAFYDCKLISVTIGNRVTSIGKHAFQYCSGLTSITIPNSVTSIGDHAFFGCGSLTSITLPNSVISIGERAFQYCSNLTSITIPNSVTSIGDHAFGDCTSLTSITIPNSVTSIGSGAFYRCSSLTSVTIPNSVTNIGDGAFENCSSLTSITISNNVTTIGNETFYGCSSLTSITIPNSVTSIGNIAFSNCSGLTSITIPNSVTSIGNFAFEGCFRLTSVTIPNSVTSIGTAAFSVCSGLTSIIVESGNTVYDSRNNCNAIIETATNTLIAGCMNTTIPNSVTSIGERVFFGCTSLTSITIPNGVTNIGSNAFSGCSSLTSITIPNSVTSIGDWAFYNCSGMTSVTIGNSVTSIGERAFSRCSGLTSVTIPNSVTSIGEAAFGGCSSLTSVHITDISAWCNIAFKSFDSNPLYFARHLYKNRQEIKHLVIPEGVTSIGDLAFFFCSSLTSVNIPESVTSIGNHAFEVCQSITSVTISGCVASIGYGAFNGCTNLNSITISNSIISIGKAAFSSCRSLSSVHITNLVAWCNIAFASSDANPLYYAQHLYLNGQEIKELVIPEGVTSIGNYAFENCNGLTSVAIDNSVTSIGNYAFAGCSGLTDVYCYAEQVPQTSSSAFDSNIESATLHVPAESIEQYKSKKPWSDFEQVIPIIRKFTLTYIVDGEVYKTCEIEENATITPEPSPTKEGYTFSGWSYIPPTMPATDVVVMGMFVINNYTLTYKVDNQVYKSYEVEYGSTITPEPEPVKEGYTFSGWSDIPETMPAEDVTVTGTFTKNMIGTCATPTISYANGELKFNSETEGVTFHYDIDIEDDNIKNGISDKVQLSVTYHISVYATREDYYDSEVATGTLCWIDAEPRSEGIVDEDAVNEIKALPVLIQAQAGFITLQGLEAGTEVSAYNTSGMLLDTIISSQDTATLRTKLPAGSTAIVKIGQRAVKIMVK